MVSAAIATIVHVFFEALIRRMFRSLNKHTAPEPRSGERLSHAGDAA
jgi:hypothetical protein